MLLGNKTLILSMHALDVSKLIRCITRRLHPRIGSHWSRFKRMLLIRLLRATVTGLSRIAPFRSLLLHVYSCVEGGGLLRWEGLRLGHRWLWGLTSSAVLRCCLDDGS